MSGDLAPASPFSPYQKLMVGLLGTLQFTIVLDFMILSPLGATLMPALHVTPQQFGLVVSAYAFSAGLSGLLAGGFADRFDRKRLLLVVYAGFLFGTLLCGLAPDYRFLLIARVVTGFFAGVVSSTSLAIVTDLFAPTMRGRVMGVVQTAFSASQVLGIPASLYLSNLLGWHAPFLMIVGLGLLLGAVMVVRVRPVDGHLREGARQSPFRHLLETLSKPLYLRAFATTALLATGGFMLLPFGSAFSVRNLGLTLEQLPLVYLVTGVCSILAGPLVGRLSDTWGSFRTFLAGSLISMVMVLVYTHLGVTPIGWVMGVSIFLFVGISARMISSQALISTVPAPSSRGAFMSVSSSVQQVSGGIAAALAGAIVVAPSEGPLLHFDIIGFVIIGAAAMTVFLMYGLSQRVGAPAVAGAASGGGH